MMMIITSDLYVRFLCVCLCSSQVIQSHGTIHIIDQLHRRNGEHHTWVAVHLKCTIHVLFHDEINYKRRKRITINVRLLQSIRSLTKLTKGALPKALTTNTDDYALNKRRSWRSTVGVPAVILKFYANRIHSIVHFNIFSDFVFRTSAFFMLFHFPSQNLALVSEASSDPAKLRHLERISKFQTPNSSQNGCGGKLFVVNNRWTWQPHNTKTQLYDRVFAMQSSISHWIHCEQMQDTQAQLYTQQRHNCTECIYRRTLW